ncbi:MAG: CHAT domain-containing protein [Aureliella sp.]
MSFSRQWNTARWEDGSDKSWTEFSFQLLRQNQCRFGVLACWLVCGFLSTGDVVLAQAVSDLPRAEYYVARELHGAGRIAEAAEGFNAALSRARRVGQNRWIDSVPPMVMLGECFYERGNVAAALEQYDAALMLILQNQNWVNELQYDLEQLPLLDGYPKDIDWFQRSRPSQPVAIPEAVQFLVDPTQAQPTPQGGVTVPVTLLTRLDATEVLRTTGIALLRRWQLLGPLGKHSPLSQPMRDYFDGSPNDPVAWLQGSWSVLRGLSRLSMGGADASPALRSGVLLGNQFDYFMSPLALVALSAAEAEKGNFADAITALQDASLFAAEYEQHLELGMSLDGLGGLASASRRADILPSLQKATTWCTKRSVYGFSYGGASASELGVYANRLDLAERLGNQARAALRTRTISLPRAQAQLAFATALRNFAGDRSAMAVASLDSALKLMRGTPQTGVVVESVFQTQMTLDLLAGNQISPADAEQLLDQLLREPTKLDWQLKPLETLTAITTASMPAFVRHLELAYARGDEALVVERLDRIQRQRFFEALPLGGRLFAWRSALARDPNSLTPQLRQQVQQLLFGNQGLGRAKDEIERLVEVLRNGQIPLDERQLPQDLKNARMELGKLASSFENRLASQALARREMPRIVPQVANLAQLQARLTDNDLLVAFVMTGRGVFGIAMTPDKQHVWDIKDTTLIVGLMKALRKEIGLGSELPRTLPSKVIAANAKWRTTAGELRDALLPANVQEWSHKATRMIIAPNGKLWYVPFELLPDSSRGNAPFLSAHRVTYIPTLGALATAYGKQTKVSESIGLAGSFFSLDEELNSELTKQLSQAQGKHTLVPLNQKISIPDGGWLKLRSEAIWMTTRIKITPSIWDTPAIPLGRSKQSTFGSWLETPLVTPKSVVMPGIQTQFGEKDFGTGDEIFLPACGLLFSGTKSAVLARWPVGGRSASAFLRRYLDERAHQPASLAMRRAALAQWPEDFLIADEPVLLPAGKEADALTVGRHPVLWSSYILLGDDPVQP